MLACIYIFENRSRAITIPLFGEVDTMAAKKKTAKVAKSGAKIKAKAKKKK